MLNKADYEAVKRALPQSKDHTFFSILISRFGIDLETEFFFSALILGLKAIDHRPNGKKVVSSDEVRTRGFVGG